MANGRRRNLNRAWSWNVTHARAHLQAGRDPEILAFLEKKFGPIEPPARSLLRLGLFVFLAGSALNLQILR
jgi:hypothetical protein